MRPNGIGPETPFLVWALIDAICTSWLLIHWLYGGFLLNISAWFFVDDFLCTFFLRAPFCFWRLLVVRGFLSRWLFAHTPLVCMPHFKEAQHTGRLE